MNNVVLIRIPSVTFSSRIVLGKTLYDGVDKFTDWVGGQLRNRLSNVGIGCSPVVRSYKPSGSAFYASGTSGGFLVVVSAEDRVLPNAEIIVWAEPKIGFWAGIFRRETLRDKNWNWFQPPFREAVELEFQNCEVRWMTTDEFAKN